MSVPPRDTDSQAGLTHGKGRQGHQDQLRAHDSGCPGNRPRLAAGHSKPLSGKAKPLLLWTEPPAINCRGSVAAAPPQQPLRGGQPPQSKSCLRPRPSAVPSISHPLSHNPPLAGTSPDLLLYEAVGSLWQVTGMAESPVFQNTSCCLRRSSEAALASACHPSACAKLAVRLWHPLRLHHWQKAFRERTLSRALGAGRIIYEIRGSPGSEEEKSSEKQTSLWVQLLLRVWKANADQWLC